MKWCQNTYNSDSNAGYFSDFAKEELRKQKGPYTEEISVYGYAYQFANYLKTDLYFSFFLVVSKINSKHMTSKDENQCRGAVEG